MNTEKWSENIILADGDYIDKVAFDLTVNFERMIGRRIPQADMARWIECVALDGGLREKEQDNGNETQVVLIHDKDTTEMKCFTPGVYDSQLKRRGLQRPSGRVHAVSLSRRADDHENGLLHGRVADDRPAKGSATADGDCRRYYI